MKGRGFLLLQRWKVGFYSLADAPRQNLFWVKLPDLPLELLNKCVIKEIANRIGSFFWDIECFGQLDKRLAWVLVKLVLGRALLADLVGR